MKASRVRRGAGVAAAVAALAVAGTVATAPTATAKANLLDITKVSLDKTGLRLDITYSCDTGVDLQMTGYASKVTQSAAGKRNATGTIDASKVTCDYVSRTVRMPLRAAGTGFVKGDKVKVTVFYWDENGAFGTQEETTTAVL
ncbi:hypothetical protein AB0E88_22255 [Streptomyces sp. NPDC028635]|uniref:hypothetical protein n=1 Tax=Streptomyces sp. NPDC028635 TaxID=3154800 RepID=UPI0033F901B2